MTQLCVAIFFKDQEQIARDISRAAAAGAEMIELRIDRIGDISSRWDSGRLDQMFHPWSSAVDHEAARIPIIVTCRPKWEGGECALDEEHRIANLALFSRNADLFDVELASAEEDLMPLIQSRISNGRRFIMSSHDFEGRPERLYNILNELNESSCSIAKIVWTARTIRDNLEAFEILQHRQKPTIALCMGEAGLISRVLAKKFGAFLTFASLDGTAGTAPGQVSIAEMKQLYRWDAIRADTKVYGVVGSPIAHSMSPAIHNAAFESAGYNGLYVPLLVNPGYESFKAFMESFTAFKSLDLLGLSVTIPHKENALRYLKEKGAEVEPLAEQIGAVNTIVIADGKMRGFNSDYAAILDSITAKLGITREQLGQYRVAVIGAGGTGRTAVAALAACGATVVVYNRTRDRADALAKEFNGRGGKVVSGAMEKLCDSCCQIYINTSSIGMHPNVDRSPMESVPGDVLVFDAVYNPMKTKLLRQAETAGAKTIGGVEMFVRQAGAQFSAWTGHDAPLEFMRIVVENRLMK